MINPCGPLPIPEDRECSNVRGRVTDIWVRKIEEAMQDWDGRVEAYIGGEWLPGFYDQKTNSIVLNE